MNPTPDSVNAALRSIESTELPENHPRRLAQEAVKRFRSNAEIEGLPVSNRHGDRGAPVLDVNEVLRRSGPNYVGKK